MLFFILTALLASGQAAAARLVNTSAASYRAGEAAPASLVTGFGEGLAAAVVSASSSELPAALGGVTVRITDSGGVVHGARLVSVAPAQVSYLVPESAAEGAASVAVLRDGVEIAAGPLALTRVSPGLFSANADGKGPAAALGVRAGPDGAQTAFALNHWDEPFQRNMATAIDLGPDDIYRVFVSFYGTGLRNAASVAVRLNGRAARVLWHGPHPEFPGLDQVNVEVPRELLGYRSVKVELSADAAAANAVTIELLVPWHRNLDFESLSRGGLWGWSVNAAGYDVAPDASASRSGERSLRVRYNGAAEGQSATLIHQLPAQPLREKRVRLRVAVRAGSFTRGRPFLWLRTRALFETLREVRADAPGDAPEWTTIELESTIDPRTKFVLFGIGSDGDGAAWFDDMQIDVDGLPYREFGRPVGEPTAAQREWIRANAVPVESVFTGQGFADLEPLRRIAGNARIVGLGEGTHGTSEFFRMKHRVLDFLATEMGFNIFAIEGNMPEAYRLNEYVLRGTGDPFGLLNGMYLWPWNTREVLEMLEWMRVFNASGRGPVQFTGIDMQVPDVAAGIVREFVAAHDPAYRATVEAAYSRVLALPLANPPRAEAEAAAEGAREVRAYLEQSRERLLSSRPAPEVEWTIQNARIVEQATAVTVSPSYSNYRDRAMAANARWILEQAPPGSRMVVWAHDGHVSRTGGALGSYLDAWYGEGYLAIGQKFHSGRYNAVGPQGLRAYDAVASFPGALEYCLNSAGIPRFLLDLRRSDPSDPASAWLRGPLYVRSIGAAAGDGFGAASALLDDFDAILFFAETTPTSLLPFTPFQRPPG